MNTNAKIELVAETDCITGESPLWHPSEQALFWCDIPRGRLLRYDPASGKTSIVCESAGALGGLTIEADGAFILFLDGGRISRWHKGEETVLLPGIARERISRFNDTIADSRGRVLCGTMRTEAQQGVLYRIDKSILPIPVCEDVSCSNGMGFTSDLKTLYYIDSRVRTLSTFNYEIETGELSNRKTLITFPEDGSVPDGMTVDAEDHLWIAFWDGGRIARFNSTGKEVASFTLPVAKVASLTFGGTDYSTLYITTARSSDQPGEGALYKLCPGVSGRPEFRSHICS